MGLEVVTVGLLLKAAGLAAVAQEAAKQAGAPPGATPGAPSSSAGIEGPAERQAQAGRQVKAEQQALEAGATPKEIRASQEHATRTRGVRRSRASRVSGRPNVAVSVDPVGAARRALGGATKLGRRAADTSVGRAATAFGRHPVGQGLLVAGGGALIGSALAPSGSPSVNLPSRAGISSAAARAREEELRRRRGGGRARTILTSPLGIPGPAVVARPRAGGGTMTARSLLG